MTATLAIHLSDLSRVFAEESDGLSIYDCTRAAILEGSVLIDPRRLELHDTLAVLTDAGLLVKWVNPEPEDVWLYALTPKGYDTLFPLGLGRSAN